MDVVLDLRGLMTRLIDVDGVPGLVLDDGDTAVGLTAGLSAASETAVRNALDLSSLAMQLAQQLTLAVAMRVSRPL